jgi:PAS domain S-box-containing protein
LRAELERLRQLVALGEAASGFEAFGCAGHVETAARRSAALFRDVFDHLPAGIAVVDAAGRIQAANPALSGLVECPSTPLAGREWPSLLHPEDRRDAQEMMAGTSGEAEAGTLAVRLLSANGDPVWARLRITRASDAEPDGRILLFEDATPSREAAAEARRHVREMFCEAFRRAATAVHMSRLDGSISYANDAFCRLTGFNVQELLDRNVLEITHPADRQAHTEALQQFLWGDIVSHICERRYVRKDKTVARSRSSVVLVRVKEEAAHFLTLSEEIAGGGSTLP